MLDIYIYIDHYSNNHDNNIVILLNFLYKFLNILNKYIQRF